MTVVGKLSNQYVIKARPRQTLVPDEFLATWDEDMTPKLSKDFTAAHVFDSYNEASEFAHALRKKGYVAYSYPYEKERSDYYLRRVCE